MTFTHFAVSGALTAALLAPAAPAQIPTSVEFKVGIQMASTKRNVSIDDAVVDRASTPIKGLEAEIAPVNGGPGIGGRILDGSYGSSVMSLKEGRIFLGDDLLRIEGAYGQRSIFGADTTVLFSRAGMRSIIRIGGSGIAITLSGSKYLTGDFSSKKSGTGITTPNIKVNGWEGETGLSYAALRVPLFVQIGYRTEYFTYGTRAEHSSGLMLETGMWLGGR